ncbi:MAG: class I SAM-dependent methyltransferase [Nakamurella sp.]
MTVANRVVASLDTFNRNHPWSHNDAYIPWVMHQARQIRSTDRTSALDVGCGTGNLVARLATVFDSVTGIEPDPQVGDLAAGRFSGQPGVRIKQVAFEQETGEYDFISMVAVLHHLPLLQTLRTMRGMLRPGGRLAVVGVARDEQDALSVASLALNPLIGAVKHPSRSRGTPAEMTAPTAPANESLPEITAIARQLLPGIRIRRGLFWRYIAVWTAP